MAQSNESMESITSTRVDTATTSSSSSSSRANEAARTKRRIRQAATETHTQSINTISSSRRRQSVGKKKSGSYANGYSCLAAGGKFKFATINRAHNNRALLKESAPEEQLEDRYIGRVVDTLPMTEPQITNHRRHQQLLSFRESFSSSVLSIIRLFLICHFIQSSLVTTGTERRFRAEQEIFGLQQARLLGRNHDSSAKLTVIEQSRFWPAIFVAAATAAADADDGGNANWSAAASAAGDDDLQQQQQRQQERKHQMSRSMDRLLDEDILIRGRTNTASSQQVEEEEELQPAPTSPLDFIKHNHHHHRHLHNHHNHHHHHHHHAHAHSHHVKHTEPEPEAQRTAAAAAKDGQRVRRHYHGGFYDGGAADRPIVASRKGLVRGVTQKLFTGKFVDAFLGIPYAKPPIGNYRFRHPQPTDSWPGELDASKLPNSCYQVNDTFFGANFQGTLIWNANTPLSEDCLYLNIWTPFGLANTSAPSTPNKVYRPPPATDQQSKAASKRPVLVWIFGGGFYYGTSTLALYEGGLLASEEDIIVVSINYRVSALGFLYFGRPDAPGNAGLFDQMLALQWIQDNIDQFGGDPNRVTIFGESAGAVSAAFHLLSPLSRNLFSQAILQSGAATCPWGCMEPREIMTNGLRLASLLNCPSNASDLDAVVDCLLRIDPMTMVLIAQDVDPGIGLLNFPFVPVVDGSFLLEPPSESLIKSNFKRARILLGSNYDEGSAFIIYLTEFNHCPGDSDRNSNNNEPTPPPPPPPTTTSVASAAGKQLQQQQQQQHEAINHYPSSEPPSGELRDQQSMESMELVAPAGGRQQQAAALLAAPNEASNEGGGGRSTQHSLPPNYSDSNPCKPNESPSLTREGFHRTLNKHLNPYAEHPIGKEAIVYEYTNWNNPHDSVSNYDALDKIVGDYHFTCHVNEFAQRYASTGNAVYMYYFKQRSSVSQWPKWMGVLHGDEIAFVFGEPLNQLLNYTTREVELSRRMMKYWANFAKFGNPTKSSENVSMAEKWPEYANNRQYFELSGDVIRIGRGPRSKQCAFWAHYLPKLIDSYDHSHCPASSATANILNPQYRCPPMYHPLDPSYNAPDRQRSGLLNNLPSVVIVSLSVILVLSIIGLLIYAKRTGKLELNLTSGSSSD